MHNVVKKLLDMPGVTQGALADLTHLFHGVHRMLRAAS